MHSDGTKNQNSLVQIIPLRYLQKSLGTHEYFVWLPFAGSFIDLKFVVDTRHEMKWRACE